MGTCAQMKELKLYFLKVIFADCPRTFGILFKFPPTRKHVYEIFKKEWSILTLEEQDSIWSWILIVDFVPTEPWSGIINTVYGSLILEEKSCLLNED
jgi:hypothetical protein